MLAAMIAAPLFGQHMRLTRGAWPLLLALFALLAGACGGRTPISQPPSADGGSSLLPTEWCNGLDDDGDGNADETFRDDIGRYVLDAHCGHCNRACDQPLDHSNGVSCELVAETPQCVAVACLPGFALSDARRCEPVDTHGCLPCFEDNDCGPLASARCIDIDGERRCTRGCEDGCAAGYACVGDHCEPEAGSCRCPEDGSPFALACEVDTGCVGRAECQAGVQSTCTPPEERCGGGDDDCDGTIDEGFLDRHGVYSLRAEDCGACGRDCTLDSGLGLPLTCGGDPFNPGCIIACADASDGIHIGDRVDADGVLDNGCECEVRALQDSTGGATLALDDNCDGADGSVLDSFYVATSGSDLNPGSPTLPLASIDEAIRRADASRGSDEERLDVYIASGVYAETVHLLEGVRVHGGYRGDFLARDPGGFEVIVVAPSESDPDDPPGGAALIAVDVGFLPTVFEGVELRGRDAIGPSEAAVGVSLIRPGPNLVLRDLLVRAGRPGAGLPGNDGGAGSAPNSDALDGSAPRAAIEDASHSCVNGAANTAPGGDGGRNMCSGFSVRGGSGGGSVCPAALTLAASGESGRGRGDAPGGPGGEGGVTLTGPIENSTSCPSAICCGLADFNVPTAMFAPLPGGSGSDGVSGQPGDACSDPTGNFTRSGQWTAGVAFAGRRGEAGGGGGGGGAGGGVLMSFFEDLCEFPDGLGGAGGGGGAGGCGGEGGEPGQSGGPSIAILVLIGPRNHVPVIESCVLHTERGGRGGDGGNGGDGGSGGHGAFGGRVPEELRTIPPLAGPSSGERGGKGGDGGPGGGGGGGCGGSSIGVWIADGRGRLPNTAAIMSDNNFQLSLGGEPGEGGGGALSADDGGEGASLAVHVL